MRLDNGVPNAATCRSLEFGMIRCMDEVKEQVRRDMGLSVTDAQVEQVLAGKPCSMDEKARGMIRQQGRRYVEMLLSSVMEAGLRSRKPCRSSCWAAAHRWPSEASRRRTACAGLFSSRTKR